MFAGFVDRIAATAVKGVVDRSSGGELLMIVAIHSRNAKQHGKQAGRLRLR